jgi:hypothetical protein
MMCSGANPPSNLTGTSGEDVKVTTYLLLVRKLRINGATALRPTCIYGVERGNVALP